MLLTITSDHRPATDLGYLLHKHPGRLQTFGLPFGDAHVFYPEASDERCTVALLVDIDFVDRDHGWHLERCDELVAADPDWFQPTRRRMVDVTDEGSQRAATDWWTELTGAGGEGMVVKPTFLARGRKGLLQPGIKCRGREYLRIIYGPEYADPSQIERLRSRGLGRKRSLAVRELGLGVEALERASSGANPSTGCTRPCSAYWRWRANPWIRGSEEMCHAKRSPQPATKPATRPRTAHSPPSGAPTSSRTVCCAAVSSKEKNGQHRLSARTSSSSSRCLVAGKHRLACRPSASTASRLSPSTAIERARSDSSDRSRLQAIGVVADILAGPFEFEVRRH